MKFSPEQDKALIATNEWMKSGDQQVFKLFGYAGTGKTTLAKHLVGGARRRWLFAAYTGKAAHVLREKGCEGASTIHSLIYRPAGESLKHEISMLDMKIEQLKEDIHINGDDEKLESELDRLMRQRRQLIDDNEPQFSLWVNSPLNDPYVDGIVIDEVSMVDERIARDLESFGKRILVLGDPAQLPPVGAGGYYTSTEPDIMLTQVHRHASESGILRLATDIRQGKGYDGFEAHDVELVPRMEWANRREMFGMTDFPQILVGLNKTRRALNNQVREYLGFRDRTPSDGDKLVCLRNNRESGVYNGSQWIVDKASIYEDQMVGDIEIHDIVHEHERRSLSTWLHHFTGDGDDLKDMHWYDRRDFDEFDYAYAMTVHKSQGSQWNTVVLFNQSRFFRSDARRWFYTGITRASERLIIII